MINIVLRDCIPLADNDFIYDSWIKSYSNSGFSRGIPTSLYVVGQRSRIDKILGSPPTKVTIATNPEEPSVIYGYSVITGENILHYLYVKNAFRKLGIGTQLINRLFGSQVLYTHKSADIWAERILKEDPTFNEWMYDPYVLEI